MAAALSKPRQHFRTRIARIYSEEQKVKLAVPVWSVVKMSWFLVCMRLPNCYAPAGCSSHCSRGPSRISGTALSTLRPRMPHG